MLVPRASTLRSATEVYETGTPIRLYAWNSVFVVDQARMVSERGLCSPSGTYSLARATTKQRIPLLSQTGDCPLGAC